MFENAAVVVSDDLLEDIEAFIAGFPASLEEANEQRWRQRRGRNEWWDEDDDSPVSGEVDDLYRRVGERFLAGDWVGAVVGYRRLLNASIEDVDSDDGCVIGGSAEIVQEALARMIRAILADSAISHAERATSVVEVIDAYGSTHGTPSLVAVLQAHPAPIEDLDAVLGALGGACEEAARTASSWIVSNFHSIALDIAVTIGGPDGVARLARDVSMPLRDRAWERWMTELASADRLTDAIAVGAQALQATDSSHQRAGLADQYGGYQRSATSTGSASHTAATAATTTTTPCGHAGADSSNADHWCPPSPDSRCCSPSLFRSHRCVSASATPATGRRPTPPDAPTTCSPTAWVPASTAR